MRAFFDNLGLALGTFLSNPLRSLLTLLGIVIGVATVVSMMGLIEGLRIKVARDLTMLGANAFEVAKSPSGINFSPVDFRKYEARPDLRAEDMRAVRESCPSVGAVSITRFKSGQKISSEFGETRANVTLVGTTPDWTVTNGTAVAEGRFFTEMEEEDARDVAVIGYDVADPLFPSQNDVVGREIRVHGRALKVLGLLQRRGNFMGLISMDNQIVLPLQTLQRIYGNQKYTEMDISARSGELFGKAQDETIAVLRRQRGLLANEENNFEITTNESNTKMFNDLSSVISAAGVGVCLLSLVVGGIGILNIMMVSVSERTKEIGIRKALGARRRRILAQFATEAVALSLVGGVLGLVLGFGVAYGVRWVIGIPTQVPPWAVLLALGMSSGVGLLFGIYPAVRAARLDPVEAMRAE